MEGEQCERMCEDEGKEKAPLPLARGARLPIYATTGQGPRQTVMMRFMAPHEGRSTRNVGMSHQGAQVVCSGRQDRIPRARVGRPPEMSPAKLPDQKRANDTKAIEVDLVDG